MVWVKIDEEFSEHPKMVAVGPLGQAMQVAGLCYCNRHLTDGFIPRGKVPGLIDLTGTGVSWEQVVARLTDNTGPLGPVWDIVPGGYQIHDYLEYQPSREEVLAAKQQKSEAGKKGAASRWQEKRRSGSGDSASHDTRHSTRHNTCHGTTMAEPMAEAMAEACPVPGPVPVPNTDKDVETPPYSPPAVDNCEGESAVAPQEGEDDLYSSLMRTVGDRDIGLDHETFGGLVAAMDARGMPVAVAEVAADLTVDLCRDPGARGVYFQRVIKGWLERGIVTIPAAKRDAERAREKAKLRAGPPGNGPRDSGARPTERRKGA